LLAIPAFVLFPVSSFLPSWIRVVWVVVLINAVANAVDQLRASVAVGDEGIFVRKGWKTLSMSWPDIVDFRLPSRAPAFSAHPCALLSVGRLVRLTGDPLALERAEEIVARLNHELTASRQH
jgi:hypothetical protein